jgi:hypothetical protein
MYRIVNTRNEVIHDNITSYQEAWEILELTKIPLGGGGPRLEIEEFKPLVTGLGRDPDLH